MASQFNKFFLACLTIFICPKNGHFNGENRFDNDKTWAADALLAAGAQRAQSTAEWMMEAAVGG